MGSLGGMVIVIYDEKNNLPQGEVMLIEPYLREVMKLMQIIDRQVKRVDQN